MIDESRCCVVVGETVMRSSNVSCLCFAFPRASDGGWMRRSTTRSNPWMRPCSGQQPNAPQIWSVPPIQVGNSTLQLSEHNSFGATCQRSAVPLMLPVRRLSQRTALSSWTIWAPRQLRRLKHDGRPTRSRQSRQQPFSKQKGREKGQHEGASIKAAPKQPSLMEQLFPEVAKPEEKEQAAPRVVPRVPLPKVDPATSQIPTVRRKDGPETIKKSWAARKAEADMARQGRETSILVLRNASPNLTEEDFRRLIPQGRHLEGWTLEQGDILKVVPARNLANLEAKSDYYLLFTSPLNAFTYQGHVQRIHNLAALHMPRSTTSAIPPPPGYMIEGLDAHAAIQAYTLVPVTQKLELRQLRPPLTPAMQTLVRHLGFESIHGRPDKMPFEARLVMEGPQLGPTSIQSILAESAKTRGLSWDGGEGKEYKLTRWTPQSMLPAQWVHPHERDRSPQDITEQDQMTVDLVRETEGSTDKAYNELKRRTPAEVYILGFHTERAAQSFVAYWHRRPLELTDLRSRMDSPPIANVTMLW